MIRTIQTEEITRNIKEMCIEANHFLAEDMEHAMKKAAEEEKSELGKKILLQLQENLKIAGEEMIPICQDTGMAVFFVEIGQDVHFEGQWLEDAINEGVRQGYTEGYLRKSVVADPILRENTKDNTPAIIHYSIVPGDKVTITFAPLPQGMHCRAELRSCFFFSLIFPPYIFSDRLYLLNFCGVKRTFLFVTYISTNASASRSVVLVIL